MISQHRADAKRQIVADLQWQTVREEDTQNQQLLELSNQIVRLTAAISPLSSFTGAPAVEETRETGQ
jgi:hypothetical protein